MGKTITFVGLDVHKKTISVALAEDGLRGAARFVGTIYNPAEVLTKLATRLSRKGGELRFCYEAGPCGHGVWRHLRALGHDGVVVAPSLIPRKPGDRVKTDRRDALGLARLDRAGVLTPVWVPNADPEAMRDLVRARAAAVRALRRARRQLTGFLLRHGRLRQGRNWTLAHRRWLSTIRFDHPFRPSGPTDRAAGRHPCGRGRRGPARSADRRSGSGSRVGPWRPWSRPCKPCVASP